ncbi:hypothetical protein Pla100_63090 [Neorhodopirellula pilleata]|uniref:Uncharacterized protein n=1 Tax=Neorhodopirellula pilleata TaxID=2714738 RepID=A0A5C5YRR1_9BACT|nr:hypothetical protein Pla100_63090 [Neorhodopirellula pilleata]
MFGLTQKSTVPFIGSVEVSCSVKQFRVFVEVIPSDIADVVCKPLEHVSHSCSRENYASRYQSVDDAIINAERVGLALRGVVKAEDLFFIFGERVQFLRDSLFRFLESRSIPYNPADLYAPMDRQKSDGCEKSEPDPLAIVLCQVADSKSIRDAVRREQQQTSEKADGCQVSWREFQCIKNILQCRQSGLLS